MSENQQVGIVHCISSTCVMSQDYAPNNRICEVDHNSHATGHLWGYCQGSFEREHLWNGDRLSMSIKLGEFLHLILPTDNNLERHDLCSITTCNGVCLLRTGQISNTLCNFSTRSSPSEAQGCNCLELRTLLVNLVALIWLKVGPSNNDHQHYQKRDKVLCKGVQVTAIRATQCAWNPLASCSTRERNEKGCIYFISVNNFPDYINCGPKFTSFYSMATDGGNHASAMWENWLA